MFSLFFFTIAILICIRFCILCISLSVCHKHFFTLLVFEIISTSISVFHGGSVPVIYLVIYMFEFFFKVTYNGEGYGNPLQYSCLENPMGGGAW